LFAVRKELELSVDEASIRQVIEEQTQSQRRTIESFLHQLEEIIGQLEQEGDDRT
jgi:hypothetical protein